MPGDASEENPPGEDEDDEEAEPRIRGDAQMVPRGACSSCDRCPLWHKASGRFAHLHCARCQCATADHEDLSVWLHSVVEGSSRAVAVFQREGIPERACTAWSVLEARLHLETGGAFRPEHDGRGLAPLRSLSEISANGQPLCSVICPTTSDRHSFHPLLYHCFCSQTYAPRELVVIDTGDGPSAFLQQKASCNPFLVYRWFSNTRWSIGLKRNLACSLARGTVIAHFDDDDLYAPDYLKYMVREVMGAAEKPAKEDEQEADEKARSWCFTRKGASAARQFPRLALGNPSAGDPFTEQHVALLQRACGPTGHQALADEGHIAEQAPRVAATLTAWHVFDTDKRTFRHLIALADKWVYGWGFSFAYTWAAWRQNPFPDMDVGEDFDFMMGLKRQPSVQVVTVEPAEAICAHTYHPAVSISGGERRHAHGGARDQQPIGRDVETPAVFAHLLPVLLQAEACRLDASGSAAAPAHDASYSVSGSWNDWADFHELRPKGRSSPLHTATIPLRTTPVTIEFKVYANRDRKQAFYPNATGSSILGPGEKHFGLSWTVLVPAGRKALHISWDPTGGRTLAAGHGDLPPRRYHVGWLLAGRVAELAELLADPRDGDVYRRTFTCARHQRHHFVIVRDADLDECFWPKQGAPGRGGAGGTVGPGRPSGDAGWVVQDRSEGGAPAAANTLCNLAVRWDGGNRELTWELSEAGSEDPLEDIPASRQAAASAAPDAAPEFTRERAVEMQKELIAAFLEETFQEKLSALWQEHQAETLARWSLVRSNFVLPVQTPIVQKYGFEPSRKGVVQSVIAFREFRGDREMDFTNQVMTHLVDPSLRGEGFEGYKECAEHFVRADRGAQKAAEAEEGGGADDAGAGSREADVHAEAFRAELEAETVAESRVRQQAASAPGVPGALLAVQVKQTEQFFCDAMNDTIKALHQIFARSSTENARECQERTGAIFAYLDQLMPQHRFEAEAAAAQCDKLVSTFKSARGICFLVQEWLTKELSERKMLVTRRSLDSAYMVVLTCLQDLALSSTTLSAAEAPALFSKLVRAVFPLEDAHEGRGRIEIIAQLPDSEDDWNITVPGYWYVEDLKRLMSDVLGLPRETRFCSYSVQGLEQIPPRVMLETLSRQIMFKGARALPPPRWCAHSGGADPASSPPWVATWWQKRGKIYKTTPVTATRLLYELRASYQEPAFLTKYTSFRKQAHAGGDAHTRLVELTFTIQREVLLRYGFAGTAAGLIEMRNEMSGHADQDGDRTVFKIRRDIHLVLDLGHSLPKMPIARVMVPPRIALHQSDSWLGHLANHGYAVIAAVASQAQVAEARGLLWDFLESTDAGRTIDRNNPSTWADGTKVGTGWPAGREDGIIHSRGIGQSRLLWYVRSLPRLRQAFARLWGTDQLVTSLDGAGVYRPYGHNPDWRLTKTKQGWCHVDQAHGKPGLHCVQGILALTDATEHTGGLVVVPGSHRFFGCELLKNYAETKKREDFIALRANDPVLVEGGGGPKLVCAKAGDLLLWDSRTVHCNTTPLVEDEAVLRGQDLLRAVCYVCMTPASWCAPDVLPKRREAFSRGITTSHWPHEFHGMDDFPLGPQLALDAAQQGLLCPPHEAEAGAAPPPGRVSVLPERKFVVTADSAAVRRTPTLEWGKPIGSIKRGQVCTGYTFEKWLRLASWKQDHDEAWVLIDGCLRPL